MNVSRTNPRGLTWWSSRLAPLVAIALAMPFAFSEGKAQAPGSGEATTSQGTVAELDNRPDGRNRRGGARRRDSDPLAASSGRQVLGDRDPRRPRPGRGWMENGPAGDTHLEVQNVTNLRTNDSRENDALPPGPGPRRRPPPPPPA